jgi:hypothetical protein
LTARKASSQALATLGGAVLLAIVAVAGVLARVDPIRVSRSTPLTPLAGVRPVGAAHLDSGISYGPTIDLFAPAPFSGLGDRWRVLGSLPGTVMLGPRGRRSRYFGLGFMVAALHGPGKLSLGTSLGEGEVYPVSQGAANAQVVRAGPFRAPIDQPVSIRLASYAIASHEKAGPIMLVSPIQAWYLRAGEAVMRMPALRERARGLTGYPIPAARRASFSVTPGLEGSVRVRFAQVSDAPGSLVEVSVGGSTRGVRASGRPQGETLGPFQAGESIVVKLDAPRRTPRPHWLLLSHLRLVPVKASRRG